MSKANFLIIIYFLGIVPSLFAMELDDDEYNWPTLVFLFSDDENENLQKSDCEKHEAMNFHSTTNDNHSSYNRLQQRLAELSYSSSEESEHMTCPYCDESLLDISFEFDEHDNKYICAHCAIKHPWLEYETEDLYQSAENPIDTNSESSEIETLIIATFEDDEPLFNHKMGNTRSHAIQQSYRAKKSKLRNQKTIVVWPKSEKKLRALEQKILAGKPK